MAEGKTVESSERAVTHEESSGGVYEWMSKETMGNKLGARKTNA